MSIYSIYLCVLKYNIQTLYTAPPEVQLKVTPEDQCGLRRKLAPQKRRGRKPKGKTTTVTKKSKTKDKAEKTSKPRSKGKAKAAAKPKQTKKRPTKKGVSHDEPPGDEHTGCPEPAGRKKCEAFERTYGCSRCRYAAKGCKTCRQPGFKPRGPRQEVAKPGPVDVD